MAQDSIRLPYKLLSRVNIDNSVTEKWLPAEERKCGFPEGEHIFTKEQRWKWSLHS
jgi:hypothetical protein